MRGGGGEGAAEHEGGGGEGADTKKPSHCHAVLERGKVAGTALLQL